MEVHQSLVGIKCIIRMDYAGLILMLFYQPRFINWCLNLPTRFLRTRKGGLERSLRGVLAVSFDPLQPFLPQARVAKDMMNNIPERARQLILDPEFTGFTDSLVAVESDVHRPTFRDCV